MKLLLGLGVVFGVVALVGGWLSRNSGGRNLIPWAAAELALFAMLLTWDSGNWVHVLTIVASVALFGVALAQTGLGPLRHDRVLQVWLGFTGVVVLASMPSAPEIPPGVLNTGLVLFGALTLAVLVRATWRVVAAFRTLHVRRP